MQTSGALCRGIAASYSVVIVRESGRPGIPEAVVVEPISRPVLNPPPSRRMTAVCCLAVCTPELHRTHHDTEANLGALSRLQRIFLQETLKVLLHRIGQRDRITHVVDREVEAEAHNSGKFGLAVRLF